MEQCQYLNLVHLGAFLGDIQFRVQFRLGSNPPDVNLYIPGTSWIYRLVYPPGLVPEATTEMMVNCFHGSPQYNIAYKFIHESTITSGIPAAQKSSEELEKWANELPSNTEYSRKGGLLVKFTHGTRSIWGLFVYLLVYPQYDMCKVRLEVAKIAAEENDWNIVKTLMQENKKLKTELAMLRAEVENIKTRLE